MGRRRLVEAAKPALESLVAVLIGLLIAVIILWVSGFNPIDVLYRGFRHSLFTLQGLYNTLAASIPLVFTAITWAVGIRVGVFNVGAEGAVLLGGISAIAAGGLVPLPAGLSHIFVALIALLAGAIWIVPVAFLKIKRNVHEVVSTIMLNYVAIFLTSFFVVQVLSDPETPTRTIQILPSTRLHSLVPGTTLTLDIFLSTFFALLVYFILWHTKVGQHMRASGFDRETARNSGIDTQKMIYFAFAIGGASAGLAGFSLTVGLPPTWSISEKLGTLTGYGFTGIAVASIARNHPVACVFSAILFSALMTSQSYLQMFLGVPPAITDVIIGTVIVVLALPDLLTRIGLLSARLRG